jgi:hypothetical protein
VQRSDQKIEKTPGQKIFQCLPSMYASQSSAARVWASRICKHLHVCSVLFFYRVAVSSPLVAWVDVTLVGFHTYGGFPGRPHAGDEPVAATSRRGGGSSPSEQRSMVDGPSVDHRTARDFARRKGSPSFSEAFIWQQIV